MPIRISGFLAVLAALALPALSQASVTATVRVEGQAATLLPATTVTLPDTGTFQTNDGQTCALNSVAGAIDAAVGPTGWDRNAFTSTILAESHTFSANDYWAEWLDEKYGGGICSDIVQEGDRVLMLVDVSDSSFNPTVFPLAITSAPSAVTAGRAFTVTVTEYTTSGAPGTGTATPAQGVTVTVGGTSAVTGADGTATLTLNDAGTYTLRASRGTAGRSEPRTVSATAAPSGGPSSPASPPPGPQPVTQESANSSVPPAPATAPADTTAPVGLVSGIEDGSVFTRADAPRELHGAVGQPGDGSRLAAPDPSGIAWVKIRLTRTKGHRCSWYSSTREQFKHSACGEVRSRWYFQVSNTSTWSYLLPNRLPRGRYVLDVKAADRAGNVDTARRRGVNRVAFRVR